MSTKTQEIALLTETSWEVCNKVGGIYTVLSTKAKTLTDKYGDKVVFIGPDVWSEEKPSPWFEEQFDTPLTAWQQQVWLPVGVEVRVGRWQIPGNPLVILVKYDGMYADKDRFYGEMWNLYGVDSLHAYGDYDESCAFAHAAGIVVESLVNYFNLQNSAGAVAHFDEWMTGMGLLYIKHKCPSVGTVFTTHATSIGRSICGNGKPLYDQLKNYNGDQMAQQLNMQSKHSLEKAAALNADVFTTVSAITADECAQLLGRRPDVVTLNGFEADFVPAGRAYAPKRRAARNTLLRVAQTLTGVEYGPDTFIVATSGRCEYRNKGLDVYLDALNDLAAKNPARRVLAYIMVPSWIDGPREDLRVALDNGNTHGLANPVVTHNIHYGYNDPVLSRIYQLDFESRLKGNVSVIYVPCYLNGVDGIFDKTYYQLLIGMDATVFASYYEPWGYTPLESVAFGVPTVTTSLSGFGRWVLDNFRNDFDACGVEVVNRTDSNYDQVCQAIAGALGRLTEMGADEVKQVVAAARATAARADWANFITAYYTAYDMAVADARSRLKVKG